jgi:Protein of unknown function (DUF3499)
MSVTTRAWARPRDRQDDHGAAPWHRFTLEPEGHLGHDAGTPRKSADPPVASAIMIRRRSCSRSTCARSAVATLTFDYSDSTAVLGPLATYAEPHAYDLCEPHANSLSAPLGWEVIRLSRAEGQPPPTEDDLLALADAVREAARAQPAPTRPSDGPTGRPHLRLVRSTDA